MMLRIQHLFEQLDYSLLMIHKEKNLVLILQFLLKTKLEIIAGLFGAFVSQCKNPTELF